jgi:outer membrane protein insertion porin family/translocation and assembly module TamA
LAAEPLRGGLCSQSGVDEFGGVNWLVSAEFSQPLLGQTAALRTSVFFERQSLQDVFVRRAVGVDLAVTQAVGTNSAFTLAYRPQLTELEAAEVFFCTSFLVCTPEDVATLQEPNWLSPVSVNLVRARTNSLLNPTRGYQVLLNYEHASAVTGSDFQYNRAFAEVTGYLEMRRGHVLAARVRGGWVSAGVFTPLAGGPNVIHPQKRFFSGGANSVRGFAQNQLGPRVLTVDPAELLISGSDTEPALCDPAEIMDFTCDANILYPGAFGTPRPIGGSKVLEGGVEYRIAVGQRLETAVFVDFGRMWTESGVGNRFEISPGIGVRYLSPIGPLRVDLGYRFRESEDLQVVTSQIRPFTPEDDPKDRISRSVGGMEAVIEYVPSGALALLGPLVSFGPSGGFSLSRLQLHLSIGQAF